MRGRANGEHYNSSPTLLLLKGPTLISSAMEDMQYVNTFPLHAVINNVVTYRKPSRTRMNLIRCHSQSWFCAKQSKQLVNAGNPPIGMMDTIYSNVFPDICEITIGPA